jgi:hypothetical protein
MRDGGESRVRTHARGVSGCRGGAGRIRDSKRAHVFVKTGGAGPIATGEDIRAAGSRMVRNLGLSAPLVG